MLSLAGLQVPEHFDSVPFLGRKRRERRYVFGQRSRMDERYDLQRSVRDERYLYVRNYMPHRPYGQSMAYMWQQRGYQDWEQAHLDGTVTPVQEAFWDEKPAEELYDLDRDPDQIANLAGTRRHRDELQRMRRALDAHLLDTNDNGFIPEGSPLEGYDESRAPGAFPIKKVLRVAGTAIERDPDNLGDLAGALGDDNEAVRYWAAPGRRSRRSPRRWRTTRRRRSASSSRRRSPGSATAVAPSRSSRRRSTRTPASASACSRSTR